MSGWAAAGARSTPGEGRGEPDGRIRVHEQRQHQRVARNADPPAAAAATRRTSESGYECAAEQIRLKLRASSAASRAGCSPPSAAEQRPGVPAAPARARTPEQAVAAQERHHDHPGVSVSASGRSAEAHPTGSDTGRRRRPTSAEGAGARRIERERGCGRQQAVVLEFSTHSRTHPPRGHVPDPAAYRRDRLNRAGCQRIATSLTTSRRPSASGRDSSHRRRAGAPSALRRARRDIARGRRRPSGRSRSSSPGPVVSVTDGPVMPARGW